MAITIEVQDRGFLQLGKDFILPLTFSATDIGKLGSNQGSFSTTIKVPLNSHNNKILDYINNLTYDSKFRNKNIPVNLWENKT